MKKLLLPLQYALLSISLIFSVSSVADDLSVDQLMKELEQQLQISQEKYEKLKPELKLELEAKTKELSATLDAVHERGLTELEKLREQYETASDASSEKLKALLESEEAIEFKEFLSGLDEDAIRRGRDELVAQFIELLELTSDQVVALKPLLYEKLEHLGVILSSYLEEGKDNFEQFREELEVESRKNIEQFKEVLRPEQFEKYQEQLNEIEETIKNDVLET